MELFEPKKKNLFEKLQSKIEDVILMRPEVDEEMMEDLEEALITSDIGMDTAEKIMEGLREDIKKKRISDGAGVKERIKEIVQGLVDKGEAHQISGETPLIVLVIGVNGSGKTTSIAKMAKRFQRENKTVLLAAADTFRAAAGEQLEIWGDRLGVQVIRHSDGGDPSAVIYDGIKAAKARGIDVLICDTAGRLQTKKNLMTELEKMYRIIEREYPEAAKETLLVLDGTTGKNAISQAKEFHEVSKLTGIVLTKLDGTAKGGIVVTIADQFDIPVKFIGTGEGIDDLIPFDPAAFANEIFS
ncbi:MAG: signal recognition particle-docking protein FtsY [Firmicutes bacterium HGW-Firmicutes-11]|nr:MAG: signal recognition particle-docking protein FtsY [Firmicutes bacterium HGW-Firmicutes-11]